LSDSYSRGASRETDLTRFSRKMSKSGVREIWEPAPVQDTDQKYSSWLSIPFASVSVFVILISMFTVSMHLGGWTWSSWTYAFALGIIVPLAILEWKRKVVISGFAVLLLFFMVVIDAGLPGYFGYNPSDYNWYDNLAHFLGTLVLTLFLWSFICWTASPTGPPRVNGHRKFLAAIITMLLISFVFEFAEFFTDAFFGWANFHPGIDVVGDLIFDTAGIAVAAFMIARHKTSVVRRPFWHSEESSV